MKLNSIRKYFGLRNQYIKKYKRASPLGICVHYYPAWSCSLQFGRSPIIDRIPWIVFPALQSLKSTIKPPGRFFEYGVGGSTLFFLDNGWEVVSVEHNADWYHSVKEQIPDGSKWHGSIVPPRPLFQDELEDSRFRSSFPGYEGFSFKDYVMTLASYPDNFFDAILVDGRARVDAIRLAQSKLARNGILILDNAERPRYAAVIDELAQKGWLYKRFTGPGPFVDYEFWDTIYFSLPAT